MTLADLHLEFLASYQAEHGHGTKPPVAKSKAFSNWYVNRVRRYRTRVLLRPELVAMPPQDIIRLAAHGLLSLDPKDPRYVLAKTDPERPKGFDQASAVLADRCANGHFPSMLSSARAERHVALWLIRIISGMLADKHVGVAIGGVRREVIDSIWGSYATADNAMVVVREWAAFLRALTHIEVTGRFERIDSWHRAVVDLAPAAPRVAAIRHLENKNVASEPGFRARVAELEPASNATEVITYMNLALAKSRRPFVFRMGRPETERFDSYLATAPKPRPTATVAA